MRAYMDARAQGAPRDNLAAKRFSQVQGDLKEIATLWQTMLRENTPGVEERAKLEELGDQIAIVAGRQIQLQKNMQQALQDLALIADDRRQLVKELLKLQVQARQSAKKKIQLPEHHRGHPDAASYAGVSKCR